MAFRFLRFLELSWLSLQFLFKIPPLLMTRFQMRKNWKSQMCWNAPKYGFRRRRRWFFWGSENYLKYPPLVNDDLETRGYFLLKNVVIHSKLGANCFGNSIFYFNCILTFPHPPILIRSLPNFSASSIKETYDLILTLRALSPV